MPENDQPEPYKTPIILHDGALTEADEFAKASFHFREYAVTLARLIADKKTKTPFALGISGAWGSGKTTLLRRLQAMLDETRVLLEPGKPAQISFINQTGETPADYRACRTVWFNAWKYASEDKLLVALVRVIVQAMFRDDFISRGAAAILEPFTPRRDVIETVLGWFSVKSPFGEAKVSTGKAVPTPFAENTALLDLFDEAFERLLAAWVHHSLDATKIEPEKGVLVVFIDDLDRCLPDKMIQVLEAIKLFMDKRGCVFVLGADKNIIKQAVEKEYERAGVKGQTAGDYLEKVIQLNFPLPLIPDDDMDAFVKSQISDAGLSTHWQLVTRGAGSNPRKVKTFLNDLQLIWAVWQNTGQARGVDFDDFVRWEVLMRSAPLLRNRIYVSFSDSATRARLISQAFEWAAGNDEAAASFRADVDESVRRVLQELEPYKARFTAEVIDRLIYLSAAAPVDETAGQAKPPGETPTAVSISRQVLEFQKGARRGEEKVTPGGQEIFEFGGLEFVKIPRGEFLMGSSEKNKAASEDERPQHTVNITYDYYIGRFPVTNQEFARFKPAHEIPSGKADHPVVHVSWNNARGFVGWLNEVHIFEAPEGYNFSLPTEAEWEKAARGEFGNEYPWGNQFDKTRCNTEEGEKNATTPVGFYSPGGDSPYGCADMAGNVWEWCRDWYDAQEYARRTQGGTHVVDPGGAARGDRRVARGGSWVSTRNGARCASRRRDVPDHFSFNLGFRLVLAPKRS